MGFLLKMIISGFLGTPISGHTQIPKFSWAGYLRTVAGNWHPGIPEKEAGMTEIGCISSHLPPPPPDRLPWAPGKELAKLGTMTVMPRIRLYVIYANIKG